MHEEKETHLQAAQAGLSELRRLAQGQTPEDTQLLRRVTTGLDTLTDFLKKHYLESYIPQGGSKIKFITGRPGSGKTHLSRVLSAEASELGYVCVRFSAREVWLHDFREIYLEIFRQCGFESLLTGCAERIVREMGYDPALIGQGRSFLDYLAERSEGDPLSKNEIRSALRRYFTRNPLLDNAFAASCSLLTGGLLGHPVLEPSNRELLLGYLRGDKTVKLSQLRALGLSPSPITRFNARHLLRSLAELVRLSGRAGLLVVIDDMETLLSRAPGSAMRYTKTRREDSYESIRQLIDDIDSMRSLLFLLCFDRELVDEDSYGVKSYQALWLRMQNEIVSTRFNGFADMIDLDRYADEAYSEEVLCRMSARFAQLFRDAGLPGAALEPEQASALRERGQYGGVGLPYLVSRASAQEGAQENV